MLKLKKYQMNIFLDNICNIVQVFIVEYDFEEHITSWKLIKWYFKNKIKSLNHIDTISHI